jgi:hypothetical protein
MSLDEWLVWATRIYFGAGVVLALATAVTVVAGVAQNKLSEAITARQAGGRQQAIRRDCCPPCDGRAVEQPEEVLPIAD